MWAYVLTCKHAYIITCRHGSEHAGMHHIFLSKQKQLFKISCAYLLLLAKNNNFTASAPNSIHSAMNKVEEDVPYLPATSTR